MGRSRDDEWGSGSGGVWALSFSVSQLFFVGYPGTELEF